MFRPKWSQRVRNILYQKMSIKPVSSWVLLFSLASVFDFVFLSSTEICLFFFLELKARSKTHIKMSYAKSLSHLIFIYALELRAIIAE